MEYVTATSVSVWSAVAAVCGQAMQAVAGLLEPATQLYFAIQGSGGETQKEIQKTSDATNEIIQLSDKIDPEWQVPRETCWKNKC